MIELWGTDDCGACITAREILGKTPLEWKYVDVSAFNFPDLIPRLVLKDGRHIVGLPAIKQYVKKWMKDMGFPEGMI